MADTCRVVVRFSARRRRIIHPIAIILYHCVVTCCAVVFVVVSSVFETIAKNRARLPGGEKN